MFRKIILKDFPGYKITNDAQLFSCWKLIRDKQTGRMKSIVTDVEKKLKPLNNIKRGCLMFTLKDYCGKVIAQIRKLFKEKRISQLELAKLFNVCGSNISLIISNKRWEHV